jgi:hypothetical protein
MRIVLSSENFAAAGGTETYTVTVARELDQLGHEPRIYSPNHGEMAELAREQGVAVMNSLQLPRACDLVIASDTATCHELAGRYPQALVVFVAHSADHMLQAPTQLQDRCQAIVVLNDRVRRVVEARAWHAPVVRLRQPIDLHRYRELGPGRSTARTALVLSNYLDGPRAKLIEDGCRANGFDVAWTGATTRSTTTPEFAIADADLVIGLGRSVLEAMAAGRAAYVYGIVGGDGWVTPDRYPEMEADGFAGTSRSELTIDADRMAADLGAWNQKMGELNRDLTSAHHGAREHATALVNLARHPENPSPPRELSLSDELAHLIRLQWRSEARAAASQAEAARLRSLLAELELDTATLRTQTADAARVRSLHAEIELEAATLRARLAKADADLTRLRGTRRYRLACRIAAPLDRLRGLGGVK